MIEKAPRHPQGLYSIGMVFHRLLALVGFFALIIVGVGYAQWQAFWQGLDAEAPAVYAEMAKILLETGSIAEATVWKMPVVSGVSADAVADSIRVAANDLNFKSVGELPLSEQVTALRDGKPYRRVTIFMLCNAETAARMLDYQAAFSAYLPCRIALVEDPQGQLWLYALNMDLMIYGGKPLPPELLAEALQVREMTLTIMKRGAAGDL